MKYSTNVLMICNIITKKHTNTNNSYFSTVHKFAQNKTSNLKPTTHSHYGSRHFVNNTCEAPRKLQLVRLQSDMTRSPAIAEGPRDAGVPVEIW